jgi:O-antigen ligase
MEMIAVIAAMAALVWGVVFFRKTGLLGGCLVLLLAGCCFGYPFYVLPVRPIPITIDRLLWLTMVVLFLVERALGWIERKELGAADWALVAFVVWLGASVVTHDWQWQNYHPVAQLLFFYLMPVGLYWIVRETPLSDRSVVVMSVVMAVFGLYLAVTAVAEVTRQAWLVFPKYMTLPTELQFYGRGRGPMLNPIGNGFYQSVCLFAGLALWPRLGRWGRLGLLVFLAVLSVGIWCTATRSVWMGVAAGLMLMILLAAPRSWRASIVAAALIGGTLLAATQWDRLLAFKRDEYLSAEEAARSVELRPILAQVAWDMFLDRPLAGCGYGQYFNTYNDYLTDRSVDLPLERARPYCQHNVFLSLLVETGLIGMGLFLALLALWTRDAWRTWRQFDAPPWRRQLGLVFLAVMAAYAANAMFHEMSIIPTVNMLLFFMAGLAAGARPPAANAQPASNVS